MNLEEYCNSLPKTQQLELALHVTKTALPAWEDYTDNHPLSYRDSVVNLQHDVPKRLLTDTVEELEKSPANMEKLRQLHALFQDPIIALQDGDWKLPNALEKIFYAVYNLSEAALTNAPTISLAINQAIEALETEKILSEVQIRDIIQEYGTQPDRKNQTDA